MASKMSVLELIEPSYPYLRSAMVCFPLVHLLLLFGGKCIVKEVTPVLSVVSALASISIVWNIFIVFLKPCP